MSIIPPRPNEPNPAPPPFRDALAELVQIGMAVARLVGKVAETETAVAETVTQINAAEGASPMPASLAEAIEADRAAAAATESRHAVIARAEALAAAFARVSRSIRLTVAMAERLDRGWARPTKSDNRLAMAKRQVARGVEDVIAREAEGEHAERLRESLTERMDSPDWEEEFANLPTEEIIAIICRELRLDPVRTTVKSPVPGVISPADIKEAGLRPGGKAAWPTITPQRRPDG